MTKKGTTCQTPEIIKAIMGRKGLRSPKPSQEDIAGRRAAYVWRWARFHGGADVTMPCTVDNAGSLDSGRIQLAHF